MVVGRGQYDETGRELRFDPVPAGSVQVVQVFGEGRGELARASVRPGETVHVRLP